MSRTPRFTLLAAATAALALLSLGACSDDDTSSQDSAVAGDATTADAGAGSDGSAGSDGGSDAATPLSLGGFVDFPADDKGVISGSVPVKGDEKFMLVLTSLDDEGLVQHAYSLTKVSAMQGEVPRVLRAAAQRALPPAPQRAASQASDAPTTHRCTFHERLTKVLTEARARGGLPTPSFSAAGTPPKLGEKRDFKLSVKGGGVVTISAEAVHVDGTSVFWLDKTTTPLATIDSKDLTALADGFTNIIVPRERVYFGKESDIDGDGRISVLLSPLVAKNSVAYVSPCDLVSPGALKGCAASNGMELVYLSPPSSLQPPYNTARALLETVAHEFQHAIYFYRKYVLNKTVGTADENPYVTEGLSHLAQDLSGYQSGNLYVMQATLKSIDLVSVPNTVGDAIKQYVPGSADGVMRGAGYLLLRYLFDQAGGDTIDDKGNPLDKGGIKWLRDYIDQPETGLPSLLKAAKVSYADLVPQYWTAIALSNRVAGGKPVSTDKRFGFLPTTTDPVTGRQRGCDLFGATHAGPITGPATQDLDKADGKLRPGGAEFLLLSAPSGKPTLDIELSTAPKLKATARLIRIR